MAAPLLTVAGATGPVLGAVGQLAGGLLGFAGAREQNAANARAAREQMAFQTRSQSRAMEFNAAQAKQQMDFQERMSNTSFQRQVEDLRAAGLNPALAYRSGGAIAPPGAAGSAASAQGAMATRQSQVLTGISTALSIAKGLEEVRLMSRQGDAAMYGATAQLTNALTQAGLSEAQIGQLVAQTGLTKAQAASEAYRQEELKASAEMWNMLGKFGPGVKAIGGLLKFLR